MSGLLKRIVILFALFSASNVPAEAQKNYIIVFYNVENLYDTRKDSMISDEEFTPSSTKHWTKSRFEDKIRMIYKALITAGNGQCPDIIGLAEIENLWVIEQLISKTPLNKAPYRIIHKESPDLRGIDVALLYREDRVQPVDYEHIQISGSGRYKFISRDILHFKAELEKEQIHFFVDHWPSRSGGYIETKEKRDITARILRQNIDSLLTENPDAHLILMGDFNATPKEKCFTNILKAFPYPGNHDPATLVNLSTHWTKHADGTIKSGGQWEIFDQMICSPNLITNRPLKIDIEKSGICNFDFLLEPDPTYLGKKPFRTYLGPRYHGGISDHLPIKLSISAE